MDNDKAQRMEQKKSLRMQNVSFTEEESGTQKMKCLAQSYTDNLWVPHWHWSLRHSDQFWLPCWISELMINLGFRDLPLPLPS